MSLESTNSPGVTAGGTEAADRVADVLIMLGRADSPLGVSEISRSLDISKTVVHRVLQSLSSRSLARVATNSSRYVLGPAAIGLASKAWSQLDIRSVARPTLKKLRDLTLETTTLSVLTGHSRIYLDQYESPKEVKMVVEIGPKYPLHSGASSRSILAFLPQPFIDEAANQLRLIRDDFDVDQFRASLAEVRAKGYAISINERGTGAASIAAPFFDSAGHAMGSVSSSGLASRFEGHNHDKQAAQVLEAAAEITSLINR